MRSWRAVSRACAVGVIIAATPSVATGQEALIPAVQINGRGHGHGVGMAQDGALAMGKAGANVKDILGHFYPGTAIGKATGHVRVPVFTGNNVELSFPEGGEIRSSNHATRIPPGGAAVLVREGDGTRVHTGAAPTPSPSPSTTSTTRAVATTSTTTAQTPTSTSTTLLPVDARKRAANAPSPTASTTTTTHPPSPPSAAAVHYGTINAVPAGDGRVGVSPRNRRYRGVIEVTPVSNTLRFVNQVGVETYLRGMGEVRNPSWPAAGLQAQAIAARTYALRAMSIGGELCDTQRCQVYIGSDAEYAAMDKAVAATSGQVLTYGNSLISAVYSANAGGHTANREEGFGLAGDTHPYLRPAPYLTDNQGEWTVTVALSDVARRLNYAGVVNATNVTRRGPSGRATAITLVGSIGDKTVSGIEFDRALGLRSTLFSVRMVMASKVASLDGGSVLQAPPEEAPALAAALPEPPPTAAAIPVRLQQPIDDPGKVGFASLMAAALWGAVVVSAFFWRRRTKGAISRLLS